VSAQLARVGVSAETWRSFRQLAVRRGLSVTAYLGKLVEAELRRHAKTGFGSLVEDATPRDEALGALGEVRSAIDELDDIAGRLARSALAHGASWSDVGSSLQLKAGVAEQAYGRERGASPGPAVQS
jgi:hypothetical protein